MIIGAIISFVAFWTLVGYTLGRYLEDKRRGVIAADMAAKAYERGDRSGYERGYKEGYSVPIDKERYN